MTAEALAPHAAVTLSTDGGATLRARVDLIQDDALSLIVPDGVAPGAGAPVTLHWPAGPRGRWTQPGTVLRAVPPSGSGQTVLVVAPDGEPTLEQDRQFVRGGGGEPVTVDGVEGRVRDIGEQGLRARVPGAHCDLGSPVRVRVELDHDVLTLDGRVHSRGEQDEVVVRYTPDEVQAQIIRRYVLRMQTLARARVGSA